MSTETTSPSPAAVAARRGDDTTGRPGADGGDRSAPDHGGSRDATGRCRDQQLGGVAGATESFLQPLEVAHDRRAHVRVDERGRRALELGWLRIHLVRERDEVDVGELLEDQLTRAPLVRRVQVRVEERDRDRAHTELAQPAGRVPHRLFVEGGLDVAFRGDPLGYLEPHAPARDRDRAPGRPDPRCLPCSSAGTRSRRGTRRSRAARSVRPTSGSSCCRRSSCRARSTSSLRAARLHRRTRPLPRAARCRPALPPTDRRGSSASSPARTCRQARGARSR